MNNTAIIKKILIICVLLNLTSCISQYFGKSNAECTFVNNSSEDISYLSIEIYDKVYEYEDISRGESISFYHQIFSDQDYLVKYRLEDNNELISKRVGYLTHGVGSVFVKLTLDKNQNILWEYSSNN